MLSNHASGCAYCCAPSAGIASGSSGASRAICSLVSTTRRSDSSLRSFDVTTACLRPKLLCTASCASVVAPEVDIWFAAKRTLPL